VFTVAYIWIAVNSCFWGRFAICTNFLPTGERAEAAMSARSIAVDHSATGAHSLLPNMSSLDIGMYRSDKRSRDDEGEVVVTEEAPRRRRVVLDDEDISELQRFRTELRALMMDKAPERKNVINLMSDYVRSSTERRCNTALIVSYLKKYKDVKHCEPPDFTGRTSTPFSHYVADSYMVLQTVSSCALSVMGLITGGNDIEILADTVSSQEKKGYFKIMIAAAAILAFSERKRIFATIANPVSAYAITKDYACTVYKFDGSEVTYDVPLSKEAAKENMRDIGSISVPFNDANLYRCTRIFTESTIRCAEDIESDRGGSSTNPIVL
jgi:hypothetical protein